MSDLILIILSAALVNNLILVEVAGTDPALAFLRRLDVALGLALTLLILLPLLTLSTFLLNHYLLVPLQLEYLQLPVFVCVILILTLLLKQHGHRLHAKLHEQISIFLPFAGINTAVLGTALLNRQYHHDLLQSLFYGAGSALGFALVLMMLAAIFERLEVADVPAPFRGLPVVLITLALISMAFMGFSGLIVP